MNYFYPSDSIKRRGLKCESDVNNGGWGGRSKLLATSTIFYQELRKRMSNLVKLPSACPSLKVVRRKRHKWSYK